jgi:hypothetical protein
MCLNKFDQCATGYVHFIKQLDLQQWKNVRAGGVIDNVLRQECQYLDRDSADVRRTHISDMGSEMKQEIMYT